MKKAVLLLMIIGMICITGCGLTKGKKEEPTEKIEINQKIVLIYEYINYADTPTYRGFYVNSECRKVQFDFSENAKSFIKEKKGYITDDDIYQLLMDTDEAESEEFLTREDISKCYKLLSKIKDDYEFVEKSYGADRGIYCWSGVLDDGVNPPKFILLSEKGDWEGVNTDKNAKRIMKILNKAE